MENAINCFLIDDDQDDHEIFQFALHGLSRVIKLVSFYDSRDALKTFANLENPLPDIIFLDLNMPILTGKECLQLIRQIERLNKVPVIIYSTSSETKDKLETAQMGASAFITKEASIDRMTRSINEVLITYNL